MVPRLVEPNVDYQPVAAMIGALRCVPFMPPSLGASPKLETAPLAVATQ